MSEPAHADVLIVSLGSTAGLRIADEELRASLQRAGASVRVVSAPPPRRMRTLVLTDLAWARAARTQARRALASRAPPQARPALASAARPHVIYSTTTAALLWPTPGAIRFDAPAAGNRPGRHGLWQRPLERRRVGQAPLLLPWSTGSMSELPRAAAPDGRVVVVPVPVEASGATTAPGDRDIAVLTYAANPHKKGLDRVLAAWRAVRAQVPALQGEELLVAGVGERELREGGWIRAHEEGVRVLGALAPDEYRALLRRARVFACAPRREDYGIAQLEALADGCVLATTPAPGPYAALPIARELDVRLVADDLAQALLVALERPAQDYAARARQALAPFTRAAVDEVVARELLPRFAHGARLA
jgi:glycosyltransferase involved in cell wall biosynthesis